MTLVGLIVVLLVIGLLLYVLGTLPIDGTIKTVIRAVVLIVVAIWLLEVFGLVGPVGWRAPLIR